MLTVIAPSVVENTLHWAENVATTVFRIRSREAIVKYSGYVFLRLRLQVNKISLASPTPEGESFKTKLRRHVDVTSMSRQLLQKYTRR